MGVNIYFTTIVTNSVHLQNILLSQNN